MAATYKHFLAGPSPSLLADDASLHYVTTTTSFSGASEIIKHLGTLQKQVQKKKEDIINLIDGQTVIAVEVDTTLKFQTSGGVYLPGIDDNFLSDEVVQLPIMHIVSLNAEGKISQIRQQWDQGSLLKQLDIIGKTGRNWPIRDSKDQLAMIQSCLRSSGQASAQAKGRNDASVKPRATVPNAMRDPHASLQLFGSREDIENAEFPQVMSPYAGQRPKQRSPTEFLTDAPQYEDADAHLRSPCKSGLKEVQPIRIFDGQEYSESDDDDEQPKEKPTHIRAHPTRYNHFDFYDGSDAKGDSKPAPTAAQTPRSQQPSQWSFEDFTTPVKTIPVRGMRKQETQENHPIEAFEATQKNGSNKGTLSKDGVFGGAEDPLSALGDMTNVMGRGKENRSAKTQQESRIHIAGDGMGGKQGTARDFLYGGGDDAEPHRPLMVRKANQAVSHSSLWD